MKDIVDIYRNIKVTNSIRKSEYELWREKFKGLKFLSKSRISKIFGPFLFSIDFTVSLSKFEYEISPMIWLLEEDARGIGYWWSLKNSFGKDITFVYYPYNEDTEILNNFYNNRKPMTQSEKLDFIRNLDSLVLTFQDDLHISDLFKQFERNKSIDPYSQSYQQRVSEFKVKIYTYIYLNDLVQAEKILEDLDNYLQEYARPQQIGVSVPYNNKRIETIKNDLENRDNLMNEIQRSRDNKKYEKIDKAELIY